MYDGLKNHLILTNEGLGYKKQQVHRAWPYVALLFFSLGLLTGCML